MTREEKAERARAVRAVTAMHTPVKDMFPSIPEFEHDGMARRLGVKVLRPPPGRIADRVVTASRLALVQDRKAGVVHDPKPTKVREKVRASASVFDDLDARAERGRW